MQSEPSLCGRQMLAAWRKINGEANLVSEQFCKSLPLVKHSVGGAANGHSYLSFPAHYSSTAFANEQAASTTLFVIYYNGCTFDTIVSLEPSNVIVLLIIITRAH